MIQPLIDAGYNVEPEMNDSTGRTLVVEIPVKVEGVRTRRCIYVGTVKYCCFYAKVLG